MCFDLFFFYILNLKKKNSNKIMLSVFFLIKKQFLVEFLCCLFFVVVVVWCKKKLTHIQLSGITSVISLSGILDIELRSCETLFYSIRDCKGLRRIKNGKKIN